MNSDAFNVPITSEQLKHEHNIMLYHYENLEMEIKQLKKRKLEQERTYEQCKFQIVEHEKVISQLREQNNQLKRDNTKKNNELKKIRTMFQKINDYLNNEQKSEIS